MGAAMILAPPKESGHIAHETLAARSTTHTQDFIPEVTPSQRLRQPPFGRNLMALRAQGFAPTLAVLIVDGWEPVTIHDEHAPWVLVIPDGEPAGQFDFRCIAGLIVYLVTDTTDRADEIAAHAWRFHPIMVYSWAADSDVFTFHARRLP